MEDILVSSWDAFQWISNQLIQLACEKQDSRFSQLGSELYVLYTTPPRFPGQTVIDPKLLKIARIVNKACDVSTPQTIDDTGVSLHTFQRIVQCQHSNRHNEKYLVCDIKSALEHFVLKSHEFPVLLHLLHDYTPVDPSEGLATILEDNGANLGDDETRYPDLDMINNTLYGQLRLHSSCSCPLQHLHHVRLRLSPDECGPKPDKMMFNILLKPGSGYDRNTAAQDSGGEGETRWREAAVSVARPESARQVRFDDQNARCSPSLGYMRRIRPGEFCRMIDPQADSPIYLHVWNNSMKVDETVTNRTLRRTLPPASVPMLDWLQGPRHLSRRLKVTLAYTIARSVWQYYSSSWMATPWTLKNIHLINELAIGTSHPRPHPYFMTELRQHEGQILDFCTADESEPALHMYPNVLGLAIILLEIASLQPFELEMRNGPWSATLINDYYQAAWDRAAQRELKTDVGEIYERVVDDCLDPDLFIVSESDVDTRLSIIYERIVKPLRNLYHVHRDDWDIEGDLIQFVPSQRLNGYHPTSSVQIDPNQVTVAIFCALPVEADAVRRLLEGIWPEDSIRSCRAPADSNEYTIGRIMSHNVVLVHMPDMGKGAASLAASSLQSTFSSIKLAVVVGVCGGVPTRRGAELILGDVVISEGIVQYDLGKQFPDTFMTQPCAQNPLPRRIRTKLAKLKTPFYHEELEEGLLAELQILHGKAGRRNVGYPGVNKDWLYQPDHPHKHHSSAHIGVCRCSESSTADVCRESREMTCEELGCGDRFLVPRKRLEASSTSPPEPKIHFGFVGSGDTVMKSGSHRDATAAMHNLVAFEMEASGICDYLPCLVIKGACDYADSHKNKHFQPYAATTAAACLCAFLKEWL